MNLPPVPHSWSLSPQEAVAVQRQMAGRVSQTPLKRAIRLVAGLDAAFAKDEKLCFAAVVVWDVAHRLVVEERTARCELTFPYVPGLLSFREVPALLQALRQLEHEPDLLLCDGQGLAHPRRFGLACHLGVLCDRPTVGCAKSRLIGEHGEPGWRRGAAVPLLDNGERIGTVLRTRDRSRPVYVSVGHRIDLATAERIVLACACRSRLPEPTRLADRLVAATKARPAAS